MSCQSSIHLMDPDENDWEAHLHCQTLLLLLDSFILALLLAPVLPGVGRPVIVDCVWCWHIRPPYVITS